MPNRERSPEARQENARASYLVSRRRFDAHVRRVANRNLFVGRDVFAI